MGAVRKYCNKAVLIEDGLIKAYGEPFNVANQYSYDNTEQIIEKDEVENIKDEVIQVENVSVSLHSPTCITPNEKVSLQFLMMSLKIFQLILLCL